MIKLDFTEWLRLANETEYKRRYRYKTNKSPYRFTTAYRAYLEMCELGDHRVFKIKDEPKKFNLNQVRVVGNTIRKGKRQNKPFITF